LKETLNVHGAIDIFCMFGLFYGCNFSDREVGV